MNIENNIDKILNDIKNTLITKNTKYGNAALEPINIFCKKNADQGILQRLDDKLMRIKNSDTPSKNDVFDIMGYLILYSIKQGWSFEDLID